MEVPVPGVDGDSGLKGGGRGGMKDGAWDADFIRGYVNYRHCIGRVGILLSRLSVL